MIRFLRSIFQNVGLIASVRELFECPSYIALIRSLLIIAAQYLWIFLWNMWRVPRRSKSGLIRSWIAMVNAAVANRINLSFERRYWVRKSFWRSWRINSIHRMTECRKCFHTTIAFLILRTELKKTKFFLLITDTSHEQAVIIFFFPFLHLLHTWDGVSTSTFCPAFLNCRANLHRVDVLFVFSHVCKFREIQSFCTYALMLNCRLIYTAALSKGAAAQGRRNVQGENFKYVLITNLLVVICD